MGFLRQWTGVSKYMVTSPSTFFEHYDESHGVGYPLSYLLLTVAIVLAPVFLVGAIFNITDPTQLGALALLMGVFTLYLWFVTVVEAAVAHVVLYLFGARGLADTFEAYAFPAIVRYGLWWFPVVNLVLGLYGLYLQIRGLAAFHDVPAWKAAVAAIVGVLLYLPVTIVVVALVASFVLALDGGGGSPGVQEALAVHVDHFAHGVGR